MRTKPSDKWSIDGLARLNAEQWQIDLLNLNPEYTCWGPHEDYMASEDGWTARAIHESWAKFGPWSLDDLNECVNFYFELSRESRDCTNCAGTGHHPDALWITESFYEHSSPFRKQSVAALRAESVMERFSGPANHPLGFENFPPESVLQRYGQNFRAFCHEMQRIGSWSEQITADEEEALRKNNRTWDGPIGHDAINRWILIEQRCKRLGVPSKCPECEGHGSVFTAPRAHVNLILWFLHPRKGCSRGVEVRNIKRAELPEVFQWLKKAAQRNAERFSKLPDK